MKRRSFLKYVGIGTMSLFIPAGFIPKEAPFETIEGLPDVDWKHLPASVTIDKSQALTMEDLTKITNDYFKRNPWNLT